MGTVFKEQSVSDPDTGTDAVFTEEKSHQSTSANIAQPVTPPYPVSGGDWAYKVDFQRKECMVQWSGAWEPPCLLGFPNIINLTIHEVYQNEEMRRCWQRSTVLDYGSYAQVRTLDGSSHYPILKIAHRSDPKRHFISREFDMLRSLKSQPVVRVRKGPVSDEDGLLGFYMQKLYKINMADLSERLDELQDALRMVHEAGVVINDVSVSNVMVDEHDKITLIDFGFAGRIGQEVPFFFPPWKARRTLFSVESDDEAFQEVRNLCLEWMP
ncbi:MAG: hypothetical protein M1814_005786 [Vezdaea aestivalis]|nr:MAG: hypothetical protein M1814_005786 [Vezdaea aestivalis]